MKPYPKKKVNPEYRISAEVLRNYRIQQKKSLEALSAETSLSMATLSNLETGKSSPRYTTIRILLDALGIPLSQFDQDVADLKKNVKRSGICSLTKQRRIRKAGLSLA